MTPDMFSAFINYLFTGDNFYQSLDDADFHDYLATFTAPTVVDHAFIGGYSSYIGLVLRHKVAGGHFTCQAAR
ncbi:hypothetical protein [Serratia sp. AKBS12]|uniref:hypothetical protein n=1 Tax=Serratia sp. AKBS12 TaxID=2974597 RepID=UPI0021658CE1|nr:hypothetical protein [Serratia sp. AKBS12]MCS3408763.1 hypothetical protein [Serratia sp. AKBS12]